MSINDYVYWETVYKTGKTPDEIKAYEHPKVVRCKDCKLHNATYCFMAYALIATDDDDYCSRGVKDNE